MTAHATPAAYRPELDTLGPRLTFAISPEKPDAGGVVTFTVTLANDTAIPLHNTVLYLLAGTEPAKAFQLGNVRPGATVTKSRQVQLATDAEGTIPFTAHVLFDVTATSSDFVRASTRVHLPYLSLRSAFNNAGISDDTKRDAADIDGS